MDAGPITQRKNNDFNSTVIEKSTADIFNITDYDGFKSNFNVITNPYECGLIFHQSEHETLSENPQWNHKRLNQDDPINSSFNIIDTRSQPNRSSESISSENSSSSHPNNSPPSTYSPSSLEKRNKSLELIGINTTSLTINSNSSSNANPGSILEFTESSLIVPRKRKATSEDEKWSENDDPDFQISNAKRVEFDYFNSGRFSESLSPPRNLRDLIPGCNSLNMTNSTSLLLNQLHSGPQETNNHSGFTTGLSLLQNACNKVSAIESEKTQVAVEVFPHFRPYSFGMENRNEPPASTSNASNMPMQNLEIPPSGRRKNATRESTATLKAWLQEHIKNPYPTKGEKIMLAIITKMTLTQVSTWFANARRRLKKENKMTWTPRNRGDDDDDDLEDGPDTEAQSDERIKNIDESTASSASPINSQEDSQRLRSRIIHPKSTSSLLEEISCGPVEESNLQMSPNNLDTNSTWDEMSKTWNTNQYHVSRGTYNPPIVTQQPYNTIANSYNFNKPFYHNMSPNYPERQETSSRSNSIAFFNSYNFNSPYSGNNPYVNQNPSWPEYLTNSGSLQLPFTTTSLRIPEENSSAFRSPTYQNHSYTNLMKRSDET